MWACSRRTSGASGVQQHAHQEPRRRSTPPSRWRDGDRKPGRHPRCFVGRALSACGTHRPRKGCGRPRGPIRDGRAMCTRSSGCPSPLSSCYTPPTYSGQRRYVQGDATQPPSVGPCRRRGAAGSLWRISEKGGLHPTTPCLGWVTFQDPYSSCSPPTSPPCCAGSWTATTG